MPTGERGFTLLGMLFLVAGLGVGMAALGTTWHTAAQRDKERQLLFVGDQYRRAIESYWQAVPPEQRRLPMTFAELVEDSRFPQPVRHLRRPYRDPFGGEEWGLVRGPDGGIAGVYSQSDAEPMKRAGFPAVYADFGAAESYRDWQFRYGGG